VRRAHSLPPRVSVIISTYNRASYLAEAIRSALAQSYADVEIIVADDGSDDNTAEVVAGFGDTVTYVGLPHSGLPAATRNGGLRVATGTFIAFLDSDDLFLPHKLSVQVPALESHPDSGFVYSNAYFFREDPQQPIGYGLDGLPSPSGDVLADLLRGNFVSSPCVALIRRSHLDVVGAFDDNPRLMAVEDYDLWLRLAAQFPVIFEPETVAAVRRHRRSMSRDVATLRSRALLVLAKLEADHPALTPSQRVALNEGFARHHGAVAAAQFRQRQFPESLDHGFQALRYSLRTPGLGIKAFLQWLRRRRLRGTAAMP
jgi:glycosyltransferase involved in cell wall biosynthesis